MNKKLFFVFILLGFVKIGFAQTYDTILYKVYYKVMLTTDTVSSKQIQDTYFLSIGNRFSKYYSYTKYLRDSSTRAEIKKGRTADILSNIGNLDTKSGSSEIVYKDYKKGISSITTQLVNDKFHIPDNEKIIWRIMPDTLSIMGYKCQKASTTFHGRNYHAWFTAEIPLQEGPWKFNGLPGLILQVTDTDNLFRFDFEGMEKPSGIAKMVMSTEGFIIVSMQKFLAQQALYYQDPIGYLKNVNGMNFELNGNVDIPKQNPPLKIELN